MIRSRSESVPNSGTLTVAAVPADNAADVTARLRAALAEAGLIAAADPGSVRRLAAALDVTLAGRVVSWAGGRPGGRLADLLTGLRAGQDVLVLIEPGAAGLDEPGRSLVSAAAAAGIPVTALPGPSPVTAALAIAGLSAGRFIVEGSLPRSADSRERRLAELATEPRTLIFTESPGRLGQMLAELAAALGADRFAAVSRALATGDQDVQRGTLGELADRLAVGAPSEGGRSADGDAFDDATLVVAGAQRQVGSAAVLASEADALKHAVADVRARVQAGATTRDAVAAVAAQAGVRKRDLYNAVGSSGTAPAPPDASGDRN